ncbi:two-component regulator propeller domain-containing protein [Draconibacterium sp. IB214405]|uniref:hybrid sensor histidine kinase/response regulator transcription factor n=1 Tax=Draconibacterium sp. IB214405 TaxID=3097352 RepID=UPI002A0CDD12|nr:two-component regulator propeller domain-containing protein [Draconibacterium sp. IB214405]MDX8338934.1 two-component regulator propeller domain-containing protein [Draconibacterium sp. IB214405]
MLITSFVLFNKQAQAVTVPGNEPYKFMHIDINNGLSNNEIKTVLKDRQGFMWFGTAQGLNRYDGTGFKTFIHDINDSTSIPFNSIEYLFEDKDGRLWIRSYQAFSIYDPVLESFSDAGNNYLDSAIPTAGLQSLFTDSKNNTWLVNSNYGLYKFNHADKTVDSIQFVPKVKSKIYNNYLSFVTEDAHQMLWAVSNAGELIQIDPVTKETIASYFLGDQVVDEFNNFQLFIDSENDIWIYSPGLPYGVFFFDHSTKQISNFSESSATFQLSNNMVTSVVEDANRAIWIGTDHGGINILDKTAKTITLLQNKTDNPTSIAQNSITYLYRDNADIIWAGTYKKGISYYHKNLIRFNHFRYSAESPNSLPYNDVNCFVEDIKGNLWIGTNGSGLIYFNRAKNTFTTYKHNPDKTNSISANIIVSLHIDSKGILWIGTYQGGLNRFDGQIFKHYQHNPDDINSLSDNRVWSILEDSKQNLWVGTLNGGLNLLDRKTGNFIHYTSSDINSVGSNFITSIIEDSEHNLWMGTSDGLDVLNLNSKRFMHYDPNPNTSGSLSDKNTLDIHEDVRGLIWVATTQGLNVLAKDQGTFHVFTEADGLANSNIKTILEDESGNLWVATLNGISKIEVKNFSHGQPISELELNIENFGLQDGLQGNEFNQKAAYRTRSGELIFGGANGFNLFKPEAISVHLPNDKIVLTNFKVFNQDVKINTPFRKRVILNKSITYSNNITLKHRENVFSIGFAALNYFHPEKNKYQYQLSGFNDEWLAINNNLNEITFTNLNAGIYQLRIRVSNDNSSWIEMNPPLQIEVLPPFWKSNYAYALYVLLVASLLFITLRILAERQRLKFEAEQEHREAERIQQIDALKTKFFTNISHEFRTPLSLIITPVEQLADNCTNEDDKKHLILIQRNARRLLAMVNQLLDFRKMELQKIEVKKDWGELIDFIKEIAASFEDLMESKNIAFLFTSSCESLPTFFDKDKTDKIFTNLLSNACKFTNEGGEITIETELETLADRTVLRTKVSDTGIGIPAAQQEQIFDRFYQTDAATSQVNQGSGIGLSMVKEYVNLLGGTVNVTSELNAGSTFTVEIPVQLFTEEEIAANSKLEKKAPKNIKTEKIQTVEPQVFDARKKTLIIVEDNADLRFYLKENLKENYNIIEASNGAQGWNSIENDLPDLVVSDVMMPEMNGVELCKKIKANRKTKHIPVVLLTAKTETNPVIEGYESGADAYLTKPFDFKVLESRIENLLRSREQLRLSYQSMIGINPEKIEVDSEDEKFIKKALLIVEDNIGEASFTVEDFGAEMGMSRVSLYKKLLALTDKTPIEFIRIIRLKRAAHLLATSQLSVSEVAYQVGFNNPRYFSKYFAQEYQLLPSEYIEKNRKSPNDLSDEVKEKFS